MDENTPVEVPLPKRKHHPLLCLLARWERELPKNANVPDRITTRALKGISR